MILDEFNNQLDNLNRTAKLFLDQEEAASFEEAQKKLHSYRLHAEYRMNNVSNQTALLTLINTASPENSWRVGGCSLRL